jgi:hypothetical protein
MSDEIMDSVVDETPLSAEDSIVDEGIEEVVEEGVEELEELEGEEKTTTETSEVNGKTIRDTVRKLSEEHPEQAKLLKQLADEHFKTESTYKKLFATPEEATTAKELIDAVGGVDGVRGLQERVGAYDANDELLNVGDPKILDDLFKQFPDGIAKLAPSYLDKLATSNPQVFNETMAPYVLGLLSQNGVINHVKSMLNETDASRLPSMVNQLATWLDNQIKGVNSLKTTPQGGNGKADPLEAERAAIREERHQIFLNKAQDAGMAKIAPVFNSIIAQQTKNFKLSESQVEHYKTTLDAKVWKNLNANPNYDKQLKIRLSNKNVTPESIAEYQAQEFNRVAKELAFDTAKNIFGSPKNVTSTKKAVATSPVTAGKTIMLAKEPSDKLIDWSKPSAEIDFINNTATLKDGRKVQWR